MLTLHTKCVHTILGAGVLYSLQNTYYLSYMLYTKIPKYLLAIWQNTYYNPTSYSKPKTYRTLPYGPFSREIQPLFSFSFLSPRNHNEHPGPLLSP